MKNLMKPELDLLCALAEAMGWELLHAMGDSLHAEKPPTCYVVDDRTHGVDVAFAVLRTATVEKQGFPAQWLSLFETWNPLESLDHAWELVEAIMPLTEPPADGQLSIAAEFGIAFPPAVWRRPRNEVARMICLAAAKAWGIQTELTP